MIMYLTNDGMHTDMIKYLVYCLFIEKVTRLKNRIGRTQGYNPSIDFRHTVKLTMTDERIKYTIFNV